MKKVFLISLFSLFCINACTENILDFRNAEISNSQIFEIGKNEPFSGKVTNVPYPKLPIKSVTQALALYTSASGNADLLKVLQIVGLKAFTSNDDSISPFLCTVHVKDGKLNGLTKCRLTNSDLEIMSFYFKDNTLEGELQINDIKEDKSTAKVFHAMLSNGQLDGNITAWDKETNNVIYTGNMVAGKQEGEYTYTNPDGSLVQIDKFQNDSLAERVFYNPETGEMLGTITYSNGFPRNGILVNYRKINGRYIVHSTLEYQDGSQLNYKEYN